MRLLAECFAELFGTLILVLVGCAGVAQSTVSNGDKGGFLSINLAFGLGAMIAVYVAGPVSGKRM
jgi:glycerol uptake facilitator-like aquaporin